MRSTRWAMAAGLAALVAACGGKETPEQASARMTAESDSAMNAIRAKDVKFAAAFNAGQFDSVAAFYMDLGRIMPPNDKSAVGRPAIKAMLAAMTDEGAPHLSLAPTDVVANGPVAIERGTYVMELTPKAGSRAPAMSDTGKYLVHWQKVSGEWQIADDIFNSDRPAAAPAPAKATKAPARSATKAPAKAPAKTPSKTKAPSKTTKSPTRKTGH